MKLRVVALAFACVAVGALVGQPIVNAAASLVTLKGAGSDNKAKVTRRGLVKIDTEARTTQGFLETIALTQPLGVATFHQGSTSTSVPADFGILTNVVVDLPSGTGSVTVTLADDVGEFWQGTVSSSHPHISDTFDNGLVWNGALDVTVAGTGADIALSGIVVGGRASAREVPPARLLNGR